MKILLLADLHFKHTDPWYTKRYKQVATQIADAHYDEVWLLGDILDMNNPSPLLLWHVRQFIQTIGDSNRPVYYLQGNHERITAKSYSLDWLATMLDILPLPEAFTREQITFAAYGHDKLHQISEAPAAHILLSHLRWSHDLYGKGELSRKVEQLVAGKYQQIILGDIHYRYAPRKNVDYIGCPWSVGYMAPQTFGGLVLEVTGNTFSPEYVDFGGPQEIVLNTTFARYPRLLSTLDVTNKYRVKVQTTPQEAKELGESVAPGNVIVVPVLTEERTTRTPAVHTQESLLDTTIQNLPEELQADLEYIVEVLKGGTP